MKNYRNELIEENPVTGEELLEEIQPLLQEYFVGEFCQDGRSLTYLMPNGRKFMLFVEAAQS